MTMDDKMIQKKGARLAALAALDKPRQDSREAAINAAKAKGMKSSEAKFDEMPPGEAEEVIQILTDLQQGIRPTEELLRRTRIGAIVNRFKLSTSSDARTLGNFIVKKWRDDVQKLKHGGTSAASRALAGSPRPTKSDTAKPTSASAPSSGKMPTPPGPPKERTWKIDGVDIAHTDNDKRNNSTALIYNGLSARSIEDSNVIWPRAVAVELAAYKHLGPETKSEYREKIRSLFMNLKNKSNPKLSVRVIEGEITGEQLVRMTSDELRSAEQRAADARIQKENMDKAMVAQQERSISKSLQCGKCGQRQVTYTEAQTRAADEPMTLFCTCLACNNSWRQ